jgi:hypothetical protein
MSVRLSASFPTPTMIFALIVGVPILMILLVPPWRQAFEVWGRAHPIWAAGIGAALFGIGFTTWSGWPTGIVVAAIWFAGWVLLGRLRR